MTFSEILLSEMRLQQILLYCIKFPFFISVSYNSWLKARSRDFQPIRTKAALVGGSGCISGFKFEAQIFCSILIQIEKQIYERHSKKYAADRFVCLYSDIRPAPAMRWSKYQVTPEQYPMGYLYPPFC